MIFLVSFPDLSQANGKGRESLTKTAGFDHSHAEWDAVLKKYVRHTGVDYAGIKATGTPSLERYLKSLEAVAEGQYRAFSQKQQLAFLINAYNAYTIRVVIEHYPIKSIRNIGPKDGSVWKKPLVSLHRIWGKSLSLNTLENGIIRKKFSEPRIHFALNCAAKGCPSLRGDAYTAKGLERQLASQTRNFIRQSSRYDPAKNTLFLSEIFKWYEEDFSKTKPSVAAYAAQYLTSEVQSAVSGGGIRVEYLPYDWSLNGK